MSIGVSEQAGIRRDSSESVPSRPTSSHPQKNKLMDRVVRPLSTILLRG